MIRAQMTPQWRVSIFRLQFPASIFSFSRLFAVSATEAMFAGFVLPTICVFTVISWRFLNLWRSLAYLINQIS